MRTVVRSAAALPCSCSRLRCRQLSQSIWESSPLLSSRSPPAPPSTRPVLLSVRVASRPRPCPTPPTEEGGEAAIGRENRGIGRGDAIGRRWLTGPGTPPRVNLPRPFLLLRKGQPLCCYCASFCLIMRPSCLYFPTGFASGALF